MRAVSHCHWKHLISLTSLEFVPCSPSLSPLPQFISSPAYSWTTNEFWFPLLQPCLSPGSSFMPSLESSFSTIHLIMNPSPPPNAADCTQDKSKLLDIFVFSRYDSCLPLCSFFTLTCLRTTGCRPHRYTYRHLKIFIT